MQLIGLKRPIGKDNMIVNKNFLKKYNKSGPRYTSYPPATFFNNDFNNEEYLNSVLKSNNEKPESISIYIHIPFCPQICHFCGCTTETGFTKPFLERYVDAVIKEIDFISKGLQSGDAWFEFNAFCFRISRIMSKK